MQFVQNPDSQQIESLELGHEVASEFILLMESNSSPHPPQEWFDRGKEDAWSGRSKQPPEHDPQAASFYDLGYSEGEIERPHTSEPQIKVD